MRSGDILNFIHLPKNSLLFVPALSHCRSMHRKIGFYYDCASFAKTGRITMYREKKLSEQSLVYKNAPYSKVSIPYTNGANKQTICSLFSLAECFNFSLGAFIRLHWYTNGWIECACASCLFAVWVWTRVELLAVFVGNVAVGVVIVAGYFTFESLTRINIFRESFWRHQMYL